VIGRKFVVVENHPIRLTQTMFTCESRYGHPRSGPSIISEFTQSQSLTWVSRLLSVCPMYFSLTQSPIFQ